jgi:hypothetical protein
MLAHEGAAVVNLHHHAAGVQNIRNLVHVILDLTDDNYKRWRDQLLLVTGKYSLEDHILEDTSAPGFPDWCRMDCVVKSCISDTISSDLAEAVMSRDATARDVWLALEEQFLGNQETRALHLDAKFRHFCQGDMSITDYCRRFKNMADALNDLGERVIDRALVLNIIRGLADRFEAVGRHLRLSWDFPMFLEVRSTLILEELTMDQRPSSTSTALLASGDKQPADIRSSSSSRPPAKQQQQSNSGNKDSSARGSSQWVPSDRRSKRASKGSQQPGSQSSSHGAPSSIKAVQCDNGREFDNSSSRTFFLTHGDQLRMSCPYTSAQNGKAERIIRSTNNIISSLLFQASIPPAYWAEALHTATHLLNLLPTKTLRFSTRHFAVFGIAPVYDHLRVFGCACYPNLSPLQPHTN